MIIKALLIAGALGFAVLLLREKAPGQKLAVRRLAGLVVAVAGIAAVMWPNTTTVVANAIGVGRGTDLVLYVLVMVFLYYAVATSQRLHQLEHKITELTRALALSRPEPPPTTDEDLAPDRDLTA
jgi:small membrane protein